MRLDRLWRRALPCRGDSLLQSKEHPPPDFEPSSVDMSAEENLSGGFRGPFKQCLLRNTERKICSFSKYLNKYLVIKVKSSIPQSHQVSIFWDDFWILPFFKAPQFIKTKTKTNKKKQSRNHLGCVPNTSLNNPRARIKGEFCADTLLIKRIHGWLKSANIV